MKIEPPVADIEAAVLMMLSVIFAPIILAHVLAMMMQ